MSEEDQTYVFNGTEVVLTGRTAKREIKSSGRHSAPRIDILHEIKPADAEDGSWKKWVRKTELYKVEK